LKFPYFYFLFFFVIRFSYPFDPFSLLTPLLIPPDFSKTYTGIQPNDKIERKEVPDQERIRIKFNLIIPVSGGW